MGTLASGSIDLKSLKIAGEGATGYITSIDNNYGIQVHAKNNNNLNYVQINSDGLEVFKTNNALPNPSSISVAYFGSEARIGKENESRIEITDSTIRALGGYEQYEGQYFEVGAGSAIISTQTERFRADESGTKTYYCAYKEASDQKPTLEVNGSEREYSSWSIPGDPITTTVQEGDIITIRYRTYSVLGYFTFGVRKNGESIGANSFSAGTSNVASGENSTAIGLNNVASGYCSYTEGVNNISSGNYSHAEGQNTQASANAAHAEGVSTIASGIYSHAEGSNTTASGFASHAEGQYSYAAGTYSHASGRRTAAHGIAQVVIGEHNQYDMYYNGSESQTWDENSRTKYVLVIGNGSTDYARRNALTVDWEGGIDIAGIPSSSSWYNQRDYAQIKRSYEPSSDTLNPFISIQTYDGDWDISTYTNNRLFFSYITDSNYSQEINTRIGYVSFDTSGNILANNLRFGPIAYGDYNTNYHWIAYSNNTYEMWYSATVSRAATTSTSNGWYRSDQYTLTPPSSISSTLLDGTSKTFTFNSIQYIDLKAITNLAYIYTNITSATVGSISYYITHLGSVSARDMTITFYIRGTWT